MTGEDDRLVRLVPFRGGRVQIISQRGIVFPRQMAAPLSIMTTAEHPEPMLRHGLQACHGNALRVVPRRADDRPGAEFLEERFELFRAAG